MTVVSKVLGSVSKFSPIKKLCTNGTIDANKFANAMFLTTMTSIIIKDGIGCAMYVTQSLNNKKIPEKKRKFVAALDLTNGGLMIASQIAMTWLFAKYNTKMFNKIFAKTFDKNGSVKKFVTTYIRMLQRKAGVDLSPKHNLFAENENMRNATFGTFKFFVNLAAATILAKRILVPFIATPLASKVEKWMNKKAGETPEPAEKKEDETKTQEQNTIDILSKPSDTTNILAQYRKSLNK